MQRAKASSPGKPQSPLVNAWQNAMGNRRTAARRRRELFILLLLFILAMLAFQAPADLSLFIQWLFSARSYGHLLALALAFWLASRTSASTQQAIFQLRDIKDAQRHIHQSAFDGKSPNLHLRSSESKRAETNNLFIRVGGPGMVEVHMENAAVFEPIEGKPRVITPNEKAQALRGFERLRALIDLRDQVLNLKVWGRTRDGIRVRVEGARVVFSIRRGAREASLREPHPFDKQAALQIVYGQRVEKGDAAKSGRGLPQTALGEQGSALFERQLQRFIARFTLGELLAASAENLERGSEQSSALFLARDSLREQFASYCADALSEQGLDLHWLDLGIWRIDELAQEILEDFQSEQVSKSPAREENLYQDIRTQELNRLFLQLAQLESDDFDRADPAKIRSRLIGAYYGLFDGLKLRYGDLLGTDEEQIDVVLRFLKSVNQQTEKEN